VILELAGGTINTAAGVGWEVDGEALPTSSEVIHSDISFK
jgi:hypothetical protein